MFSRDSPPVAVCLWESGAHMCKVVDMIRWADREREGISATRHENGWISPTKSGRASHALWEVWRRYKFDYRRTNRKERHFALPFQPARDKAISARESKAICLVSLAFSLHPRMKQNNRMVGKWLEMSSPLRLALDKGEIAFPHK